jgi:hypothetical protein
MEAKEQIKLYIDEICSKHNLKQPITVPAAAKMLMQYKGLDVARDLFQRAADESNNIFSASAYEATLETILKKD